MPLSLLNSASSVIKLVIKTSNEIHYRIQFFMAIADTQTVTTCMHNLKDIPLSTKHYYVEDENMSSNKEHKKSKYVTMII